MRLPFKSQQHNCLSIGCRLVSRLFRPKQDRESWHLDWAKTRLFLDHPPTTVASTYEQTGPRPSQGQADCPSSAGGHRKVGGRGKSRPDRAVRRKVFLSSWFVRQSNHSCAQNRALTILHEYCWLAYGDGLVRILLAVVRCMVHHGQGRGPVSDDVLLRSLVRRALTVRGAQSRR